MWDLGWFGHISFDWAFLSGLLSVIMIDLILAGDNAVVIAMAVRLLPKKQRLWGIILGAGAAGTLWQAVRLIVVADIIMSVDNMLAVAGASKGNFFLLLFGLGLSIPFVVGTSTLLSMLMDKYPIIPFIGSAILGKVAGEMMITDPLVHKLLGPPHFLEYVVEAVFAVGVIVVGKILLNRKKAKAEESADGSVHVPVSGKK
jgi:predicted tellurium resistance membrane protein TerC